MNKPEPPHAPQCAACATPNADKICRAPGGRHPKVCPTVDQPEVIARALETYARPEVAEFARLASLQEAEGYADRHRRPFVKRPCKTRIEETIEFALRIGARKVGLAFCGGLIAEARQVAEIFTAGGLEVVSVICKVGTVPKERIGLRDEEKIKSGGHETMCNPIAQAALLAEAGTGLNVLLGLCVGHDSLFFQHSKAPCTVLAVKDRVTGHNPMAPVYTSGSYYERLRRGE